MAGSLKSRGKALFEMSFLVAAGVTTYLASAARDGIQPYRIVILDNAHTQTTYGKGAQAGIKYAATGHTHGEKVIGVAIGPENSLPNGVYTPGGSGFYPLPAGRLMDVRLHGLVPIVTDSTTVATPIVIGDFVKSSATTNYDGCAAKATLTNNAPAASQHIIGVAFNGVTIASGLALVMIRPQES